MSKKSLNIEKLDKAAEIIANAQAEFDKAVQKANSIKKDALADLKEKRKNILADLAVVDDMIAEITGKPVLEGNASGKSRVGGEDLEKVVLEILTENKDGVSAKGIMEHPKTIELYKTVNKSVPQLAIPLTKMVDAKKIKKVGERKAAKYLSV